MNEPKHTPGPWRFSSHPHDGNYMRITCSSDPADGDNLRGYCGEANARLIAAAPDLLEALKAVEVAVTMGFPPAEILHDDSAIRKGIRAAIAKAEGVQP